MGKSRPGGKLTDADRDGTLPMRDLPSRGVGAPRRAVKDIKTVLRKQPEMVDSGFGPRYLTDRSRPIAADAIQLLVESWVFDIRGYHTSGAPTPTLNFYNKGQELLGMWYTYMRELGKNTLKYKHSPTTIADTENFCDFLNCGFFAIANLTMLFNVSTMSMYNQAFAALTTNLPQKRGRMSRLWDRISAVPLPAFLKDHAVLCGLITGEINGYPPYIRIWAETPVLTVLYGFSGDYVDQSGIEPYLKLTVDANLNNLLDNIEKAVQVLEGNVDVALTPDDEDIIAIRDCVDMLRDVPSHVKVFNSGLPNAAEIAGISRSAWHKTQLFGRAIILSDTKGVAGDEYNAFPTIHLSALDEKIPVMGWGECKPDYDFTLFGAAKLTQLNDDAAGIFYTPQTNPTIYYGTDMRVTRNGTRLDMYTREDGWVTPTLDVDWGDGAGIRTAENTFHPLRQHVFYPIRYASQLAGALELRFLDSLGVDYKVYVDDQDFGENYVFMLMRELNVPYLE
jgi:hypothetical protein